MTFLFSTELFANNVNIENINIISINKDEGTVLLSIDINWENSWHINDDAKNYDASWVFIKYRVDDGNGFSSWFHADLITAINETNQDAIINVTSDKKGFFIYGKDYYENKDVSFKNVKIICDNLGNTLKTNHKIEFKIYAIEMVYIPEGPFYVGDGNDEHGQFEKGKTGEPFLITSENSITLGGGRSNSLGNHDAKSMDPKDDFDDDKQKILPANFPKGFQAFYIMKYEVSQGQYVEFLNSLTRSQQQSRIRTQIDYNSSSVSDFFVLCESTSPIYRNGIRCNTNITPGVAIDFYCDLNNNGIKNEINDGIYIPCNYVGYSDLAAYMDWSGLRPMTELEFEKACRGNLYPIKGEYAWGSTSIIPCDNVINSGQDIEITIPTNCNAAGGSNYEDGPVRVGSLGNGNNGRDLSGASFYGVMELSGNLWEGVITIGNSTGRNFQGFNGDGELDFNGFSNVLTWPGNDAEGTGFRGGRFRPSSGSSSLNDLNVSYRYYSAHYYGYYSYNDGFRGCRTAE